MALQTVTKEVVGIPELQAVIKLCMSDLQKMVLHLGPTHNSQRRGPGCNFSLV